MKLPRGLLAALLAGAALLVIIGVWAGCGQPRPFGAFSSLQSAPYEGFSRMHGLEYTTYPANAATDSVETAFVGPLQAGPARLSGYAGLQPAPDAAFEPLDPFSQAPASYECAAGGLSNSRGALCLDADQKRLLSTRGGNISGGDSQIG